MDLGNRLRHNPLSVTNFGWHQLFARSPGQVARLVPPPGSTPSLLQRTCGDSQCSLWYKDTDTSSYTIHSIPVNRGPLSCGSIACRSGVPTSVILVQLDRYIDRSHTTQLEYNRCSHPVQTNPWPTFADQKVVSNYSSTYQPIHAY